MCGGAGHIMDMINRMKQNRSAKTSNRQKFKPNSNSVNTVKGKGIKSEKISATELSIINKKIKTQISKERKKQLMITLVIFLILSVVIGYSINKLI